MHYSSSSGEYVKKERKKITVPLRSEQNSQVIHSPSQPVAKAGEQKKKKKSL